MGDEPTGEVGGLAETQLTLALSAGGVGTWRWDRATGAVRWDRALEELFGLAPGGFAGTFDHWLALVHPDDRNDVQAAVDAVITSGDPYQVEHRSARPHGATRWLYCRGEAVHDVDGTLTGMRGVAVDVTERRTAEAERDRLLAAEQAARGRLAFLSQASEVLAGSLTVEAAMAELADLSVPRLGDGCVVDVLDERGAPQLAAVAHRDPAQAAAIRDWRTHHPATPVMTLDRVLRTGAAQLVPEVTDTLLGEAAGDEPHLALLRRLGLRSVAVAPLVARGRVLGALTVAHDAQSGRDHNHDDLALVEELARRAGIALDNARLYEDRARVAGVLQRALLPPELPEVPGVELAARHQPAAEMVIGGDFYDVFENGDGSWTVLIGDVCGKDTTASTLTALARHSARAAVARDSDPRSLLEVVNHAFQRHSSEEQFCSVVCARLRPDGDGATLEVAIGGHPPPLVLRADGSVEALQATGDLVGLFTDPALPTESVELRRGDTLVLYTDGVTEARHGTELFGPERLVATLGATANRKADELADDVLAAVAAFDHGDRRDDVAVLVAQVPDV